jgi:tetratricopeptide (TPR) repeat protein
LDEAIVIWRKALRLEPDQTCQCPLLESLYQTLARVYIDQGDYSAAARVVAERLTPDPTSALVFCSRAGLLSRCAQAARKDRRLPEPERQAVARDYLDQGRELVGKAADRAGANPALANNLAWYLATGEEELRDPRRAVQLAQAVVKRMPQEGNYWNTLGAALYRAGEWKAAREALTKSCALRGGGDGLDWFLLAMTCQRLDDAAQARVWYNKAVAWADARRPRDPEVQRFRAEAAAVLDDGKPKSASSK